MITKSLKNNASGEPATTTNSPPSSPEITTTPTTPSSQSSTNFTTNSTNSSSIANSSTTTNSSTSNLPPIPIINKRNTSCYNCKKAHSKCDGTIPCSQCQKRGKLCVAVQYDPSKNRRSHQYLYELHDDNDNDNNSEQQQHEQQHALSSPNTIDLNQLDHDDSDDENNNNNSSSSSKKHQQQQRRQQPEEEMIFSLEDDDNDDDDDDHETSTSSNSGARRKRNQKNNNNTNNNDNNNKNRAAKRTSSNTAPHSIIRYVPLLPSTTNASSSLITYSGGSSGSSGSASTKTLNDKNDENVENHDENHASSSSVSSTRRRGMRRAAAESSIKKRKLIQQEEEEEEEEAEAEHDNEQKRQNGEKAKNDDENDENDNGKKQLKVWKRREAPPRKIRKLRKKKNAEEDDEDFVMSGQEDDEEDDEVVGELEHEENEQDIYDDEENDDENDDDGDGENRFLVTPKKKQSSTSSLGKTPTSLSSVSVSATPMSSRTSLLGKTPKTVTKIVKSTPKKTPLRAMKLVKAPIPKRPNNKEMANEQGVVVQGLRTFFVNKSRVVRNGGAKRLVHYETNELPMICPVPTLLPNVLSNELIEFSPDSSSSLNVVDDADSMNDHVGCDTGSTRMKIFVEKSSQTVDYLATGKKLAQQQLQQQQVLERSATAYEIDVGQSVSIRNDSCLLLNVGGGSLVWCMDWCRTDALSDQYAVFGCHPRNKPFVRVDELYGGGDVEQQQQQQQSQSQAQQQGESSQRTGHSLDNMLQIWSFGKHIHATASNGTSSASDEPARCVTCIKHNHGFAWDCKWLPISVVNMSNERPILGLLAVAFSDGSLVLYTVPKLEHPPLGKVNCITLDETQLYTCTHGKDERKLFTALGWSLDGRFLASGCSDGNLIVWKVDLTASSSTPSSESTSSGSNVNGNGDSASTGSNSSSSSSSSSSSEPVMMLKKMAHVRGHFHRKYGGRVRSICWSSVDINVFATCGDDGNTRYWDIRDIFEPHCSNLVSRQWATDICYPANTTGAISVSNDGQVKQFDARENNFTCVRAHANPLWGVSIMSSRAAFAYSSADGSVMISSLEEDSIAKKPKGSPKERFDAVMFSSSLVQEQQDDDEQQQQQQKKYICISLPFNKADKKKPDAANGNGGPVEEVTDLLQKKHRDLVDDGIEMTPTTSSTKKRRGTKKKVSSADSSGVRIIPDHSLSIFSVRFHPSKHRPLRNWCILGGQAGYVCALRVPDELEI